MYTEGVSVISNWKEVSFLNIYSCHAFSHYKLFDQSDVYIYFKIYVQLYRITTYRMLVVRRMQLTDEIKLC